VKKKLTLGLGLLAGMIGALVFASGCATTTGEESSGWSSYLPIIFLVAIIAIFYFLMIRPQQKKSKQHKQMLEELKKGDQIITAGGIYGIIDSVTDDSFIIRVESGTLMRVAKGSVSIKRQN
jgi:preprotein translocase subunit YajC